MPKSSRLVLTGISAAALVAAGTGAWALFTSTTPERAPYTDDRSSGRLTLCGPDGQPVTQGSTTASPFVTSVLGSTGLPGDLDPSGAVGTIFVHQPRPGVTSEEFSGAPLTSTATLVSPSLPAVPVDEGTWSIEDFTTAYPAELDGFVQLRLVLGTPAIGTLTEVPYDSLDLWVDGDTWRAVNPGNGDCAVTTD